MWVFLCHCFRDHLFPCLKAAHCSRGREVTLPLSPAWAKRPGHSPVTAYLQGLLFVTAQDGPDIPGGEGFSCSGLQAPVVEFVGYLLKGLAAVPPASSEFPDFPQHVRR